MNVKFYLRKGKTDGRIIICVINNRTETLKVSTDYKIPNISWDKKNQLVKESEPGGAELNELLTKLKLSVLKQIRIIRLEKDDIQWNELKLKLKNYIQGGTTVVPDKENSKEQIKHSIPELMEKFLIARSAEYKAETIRKYRILLTVWQQFENYRKDSIAVNDLTYSIVEAFRLYLLNVRNNRNDTIYKMLASLKSFIRWLIKNNYHVDAKCLELRQKVKVKHDIVTLSEMEITLLQKVKLKKEHQIIRDCFLFMIFTGQRYSDMQQIQQNQVNDKIWKFQSIKTGKDMIVPMVGWSNKAYKIAENYHFSFPKYTQQYFNRAIKEICKLAKIKEQVTLKRYRGNSIVQIIQPKYNLITSHTARRTAVSTLLSKGVPPTVVMKLTGHSSIQTMMRYERTTNEVLTKALMNI